MEAEWRLFSVIKEMDTERLCAQENHRSLFITKNSFIGKAESEYMSE